LVFLVGAALIFGVYYVWQGAATFIRTGGMGVVEATQRAEIVSSATAVRVTRMATSAAAVVRPTSTPVPECQEFAVIVSDAIVREEPSLRGTIVTEYQMGTVVCMLEHVANSEFYAIDLTPDNRRIELAYMHETLIEAVNPTLTPSITPTPSDTFTPLPTVTLTPSLTPTREPSPMATDTRDPRHTDTPAPTRTPTPTITPSTQPFQSA
jgi:hypothetical protein